MEYKDILPPMELSLCSSRKIVQGMQYVKGVDWGHAGHVEPTWSAKTSCLHFVSQRTSTNKALFWQPYSGLNILPNRQSSICIRPYMQYTCTCSTLYMQYTF
jgi:hypothetical protein